MELKDWIQLAVPIISNGLLIYFIQSYFNRLLERKQNKTTQISAIIREYQLTAEKISHLLSNFSYSLEPSEEDSILSQIFSIAVKELFPYFDRHSFVLKHFEKVNLATLECVNNLRGALANHDHELSVKYLNRLNGYMQELSNACDEYILSEV